MKKMTTLIAFLMTASMMLVVLPGMISSQEIEPTSYVEGTVYDAVTEDPLEMAMVRILNGRYGYIVYTDEEGFYSIGLDVVVKEEYDILVAKEGYYDQWDYFEVERGETVVMDFYLEAMETVVKGYVLDSETSDPVQNIYVQLLSTDSEGYDQYGYTDEEGYFEIFAQPGNYKIVTWSSDHDPYQSDEFELVEGDVLWHNVSLVLRDTGIFGRVTGENSDPLTGAWVSLYTQDRRRAFGTPTDENGEYEIRCVEGEYTIEISAEEYMPYEDTVTIVNGEMLEYDAELTEISFSGILQYILDIIREIFGSIF